MEPLGDLLPHRAPMLLLDGLEGEEACLRVDPEAWYAGAAGDMPGWFGLEVMAQAVAARQGRAGGARRGYLVGTRAYVSIPAFPAGELLRVRTVPAGEDPSGLAAFDCEILLHGRTVATALLKVMLI